MKPTQIKRNTKGLVFSFSQRPDVEIAAGWLRGQCACAVCLESKTDEIPLFSSSEAMNSFYSIKKLESVGNYAFAVFWGDGHHSIYAYERLWEKLSQMELPAHLKSIGLSQP